MSPLLELNSSSFGVEEVSFWSWVILLLELGKVHSPGRKSHAKQRDLARGEPYSAQIHTPR